MAYQRVDTDELRADAAKFDEWKEQLRQLWTTCRMNDGLSGASFGTVPGMDTFNVDCMSAIHALDAYLVGDGGDGPGGIGVLRGFSEVLTQTADGYEQDEAEVDDAMRQYGIK